MIDKKFLIVFVVFLVVSITPASATIIQEANENNNATWLSDLLNEWTGKNNTINIDEAEFYEYQIEQITLGIKNDTDKLNVKIEEFNNIPKWRIIKLKNKANEIKDIAQDIGTNAKNLETVTKNFETALNQSDSMGNENNVTHLNSPANENAHHMAGKLSTNLNTAFTVDDPDSHFHIGDIVQYKDNNGYYRYVTVHNTSHSSVYLEGKDHKIIAITYNQANSTILYKLMPSTAIDSYTVVDAAYNIQLEDIDQQKNDAKDKNNTAKRFKTAAMGCVAATFVLTGIEGLFTTIILALNYLAPATCGITAAVATVFVATLLLYVSIGAMILSAAAVLQSMSNKAEHKANDLYDDANKDLEDLNTFLPDAHIPVANDMNLTTTKNNPCSANFNATDPDNDVIGSTLIQAPRHGHIEFRNNGTSFMYRPNAGFVGNDSFSYRVVDSTGLWSNSARVNIKVVNGTSYNATLNETAQNLTCTGGKNVPLNMNISSNYKIVLDQLPVHGTATVNNSVLGYPNIQYTPFKDYIGNDNFSYRLQSLEGKLSSTAWINITIKDSSNIF